MTFINEVVIYGLGHLSHFSDRFRYVVFGLSPDEGAFFVLLLHSFTASHNFREGSFILTLAGVCIPIRGRVVPDSQLRATLISGNKL